MSSIIELHKRPIAPSRGILLGSTPVAAPVGPVIETTTAENAIIARFLSFAIDDVRFQLEQTAKDPRVTKKNFEAGKEAALVISAYLAGLLNELARMSQEAAAAPVEPPPAA